MSSIWEKMVNEERKSKAAILGVRVCDLEEEEVLIQSIEANLNLNPTELVTSNATDHQISRNTLYPSVNSNEKPNKEDLAEHDDFHKLKESHASIIPKKSIKSSASASESAPASTISALIGPVIDDGSGPWIHLMQELVDKILIYVGDIDMCGYLKQTCKTVFQPTERVYRFLAEVIYLRQASRKQLVVSNWLSYGNMLIHRPRLR